LTVSYRQERGRPNSACSTQTIGRTLETLLGQRRIGTIVEDGEEYDVIVESEGTDRRQPSDLTNIMVRGTR
jgi:multidrug efflux pump